MKVTLPLTLIKALTTFRDLVPFVLAWSLMDLGITTDEK